MSNFTCIACSSPLHRHIDEIVDDRFGHNLRCSIWNCVECGYMGTFPRLNTSDLPELYSGYYPRREINPDDVYRGVTRQLGGHRVLWRKLNGTNNMGHYLAKKDDVVLDVGVGDCSSLLEMKLSGMENIYGIDPDANISCIASKYALNVEIGIFDQHSFDGIVFDLICLNQVLEHVPDPYSFLSMLRSRLSSSGKIFICVPNVNSIYRKLFKTDWINWHVPYHQHHFSNTSLLLLFKKSGYRVIKRETVTPNLWTEIQVRKSMMTGPLQAHQFSWKNSMQITHTSISVRLFNKFVRILVGSLLVIQNRVIDCLFMGDSLMYVIEKDAGFDED